MHYIKFQQQKHVWVTGFCVNRYLIYQHNITRTKADKSTNYIVIIITFNAQSESEGETEKNVQMYKKKINVQMLASVDQVCSPTHKRPVESKVRPSGHWHLKEPWVFTQRPLTHTPGNTSHSFTSRGPGERKEREREDLSYQKILRLETLTPAAGCRLLSTFNI